MAEAIKNRYEFVVLFDVENGNPNGDPDAGNMPRIDPETGYGLVTDVCLKRKIRNFVETAKEVCWIMERSVFSGRETEYFSSTSGSSGKSAAERARMSKSASPQERWTMSFSSDEKVIISSGIRRMMSPNRRAERTSSPPSCSSTGKRVRMPVCIL